LIFYLSLLLSFKTDRRLLIIFGLFYILSIYTTYLLIGFGLLKTFHLFNIHNFFGWAAAALVLLLGLFNLKEYFLPSLYVPIFSPFLSRCRIPRWNPQISLISAIVLGFLVGLCEFPCSGAIYLATVAMLSVKSTFTIGLIYLMLYNLMFVLPLIVLFAFVGHKKIFKWLNEKQISSASKIKLVMGVAMIVSSLILFFWLIRSIK